MVSVQPSLMRAEPPPWFTQQFSPSSCCLYDTHFACKVSGVTHSRRLHQSCAHNRRHCLTWGCRSAAGWSDTSGSVTGSIAMSVIAGQPGNAHNSLVYTDTYAWTKYTLTATSFSSIAGVDGGTRAVDQLTVVGKGTLTSTGYFSINTQCSFTLQSPGQASGTAYDFTMTFSCDQFVSGTKVGPDAWLPCTAMLTSTNNASTQYSA